MLSGIGRVWVFAFIVLTFSFLVSHEALAEKVKTEIWVQTALIKLGHNIGKADGKMGKLSTKALKTFQKQKSLNPYW